VGGGKTSAGAFLVQQVVLMSENHKGKTVLSKVEIKKDEKGPTQTKREYGNKAWYRSTFSSKNE